MKSVKYLRTQFVQYGCNHTQMLYVYPLPALTHHAVTALLTVP